MSPDVQKHVWVQLLVDYLGLIKTFYLNWLRAKLDSQVKCLKSSVFKWRDDIFIINILVMFVKFVFKISMEFFHCLLREIAVAVTLVWLIWKVPFFDLSEPERLKSKRRLHCSLPPCFLSSPCDIFLCLCVCVFFTFSFFLSVFFLEEDKWQVRGRLPLNLTGTALYRGACTCKSLCVCFWETTHVYFSNCLCVWQSVYFFSGACIYACPYKYAHMCA